MLSGLLLFTLFCFHEQHFSYYVIWSNECDDEMCLEFCTAHQRLPTIFKLPLLTHNLIAC